MKKKQLKTKKQSLANRKKDMEVTSKSKKKYEGLDWEKRYKTLLEFANDGIILINKKGEIIEFSRKAEEIMGYSADEVIGRRVEFLAPPEVIESQRKGFKRVIKEGRTYIPGGLQEIEWVGKKGNRIPLEISQFVIDTKEEGIILGAFIRDITERKQAEEALKESEGRYRTVVQTASDAIISTDEKGRIIFWNRAAESIFGYSADEAIGKSFTIILPEQLKERNIEGIKRAVSKGGSSYFGKVVEVTMLRKDGSEFTAETSRAMRKTGEGIFFTVVIRDITERKRMEEALQREKEFSKMIIETADVLIVSLDLEGKVVLFNKKAEEVTGYSRSEVIGKDFFEVLYLGRDKAYFIKMTQEIMQGKTVTPIDVSLNTKSGEERIISNRGTLLKDNEGNTIGLLGIGLDVTEKRKMEEKLIQSEKLRALGELSGGMAHDFNNMLAAILGRAQLLMMNLESFPGAERRKIFPLLKQGLQVIERAASDGAETVRRVQEFSRIRADDREFITLDLNEVVNHSLDFTRARWKGEAELKGIRFRIKKDLSPNTPIMGKPSELREVLTNLINNALDAMPQGGKIGIKTFKENTWVCLKIEDTGVGMPSHILENIFDPFYTTKGPKATGLGMSVSYGIITRHRGTITVDSIEEKGTTFTIKIPMREVGETKEKKVKKTPKRKEKTSILIIEDEEDIRILLSDILSSEGHKVTMASDGKEGLAIFKRGKFDLVFTDLGMPGMSGWEVASAVKKGDPEVIVAIITGWNIQFDNDELRKTDVDLIANKPFKVDQILTLTQKALEIRDKRKKGKVDGG